MFGLQLPELLIILLIVIVLFGASRLRGIGGALGGSIREFKTAVRDESAPDGKPEKVEKVDS
ncbi:MAG TPA: twin-arginine translocase TatA/TatE family subunit [Kouleothrix sp.]|nr:twin-arginine translocase TatA/TatE family subunit [Kouleothrix sp.]